MAGKPRRCGKFKKIAAELSRERQWDEFYGEVSDASVLLALALSNRADAVIQCRNVGKRALEEMALRVMRGNGLVIGDLPREAVVGAHRDTAAMLGRIGDNGALGGVTVTPLIA